MDSCTISGGSGFDVGLRTGCWNLREGCCVVFPYALWDFLDRALLLTQGHVVVYGVEVTVTYVAAANAPARKCSQLRTGRREDAVFASWYL